MRRIRVVLTSVLLLAWFPVALLAEGQVVIKHERAALERLWRTRVQSFLDRGVIPLIDLESSLKRRDGENYLPEAMEEN